PSTSKPWSAQASSDAPSRAGPTSASLKPDRSRTPTSGSASTSASGPAASTFSRDCCARNPLPRALETKMTEATTLGAYGVQTEPATVRLQRLLPGPIERVWAYLTESDLRRQWLARGDMDLKVGGKVELVWRNDDLTGHAEARPEGVPA